MDNPIDQFKEVLNKVSTPGDTAAVLLGSSAGLAADIFLMHLGIPPGYMTFLGLTTALGLKKAIDAMQIIEHSRMKSSYSLHHRAKAFYDFISEKTHKFEKDYISFDKFDRLYHLWQEGVIDDERFEKIFDDCVNKFAEIAGLKGEMRPVE